MNDTETMMAFFDRFYKNGLCLGVFEDDGYAETIGLNIVDEESTSSTSSREEEEEDEDILENLERDHPYEECVLSLCTSMWRLRDTVRRIQDMGVFKKNDHGSDDDDDDDVSMVIETSEEEKLSFYAEITHNMTHDYHYVNREDVSALADLLYRWVSCLNKMASVTNKRYPAHWKRLVRVLTNHSVGRSEYVIKHEVPLVRSLKSTYDKTKHDMVDAMSIFESTIPCRF
jgi:hypothetical protein